jgi:hypothetical protein
MFGFFWKRMKKQETAMDAVIKLIYGDNPPAKRAQIDEAVVAAHQELLLGLVEIHEVRRIAVDLNQGPLPYSTEDLALATALNLFRQPDRVMTLKRAQLAARMKALDWLQKGKAAPMVVKVFEDNLYKIYKPIWTPRKTSGGGAE